MPNAEYVTGSVCIVYDENTNKFLGFKSTNKKGLWLPGGGTENNETFELTAIRELEEETGFKKYNSVIALGDPVYSYYYNDNKNVNKRSYGQGFLFKVNADERGAPAGESHESYIESASWYTYEELVIGIKSLGGGVEHWLSMLERAKKIIEGTCYTQCYNGEGTLVNSGPYNGIPSSEARDRIVDDLSRRPNEEEPMFVQRFDPGKVKDGEPFVERDSIMAIVKHWKDDTYIGLTLIVCQPSKFTNESPCGSLALLAPPYWLPQLVHTRPLASTASNMIRPQPLLPLMPQGGTGRPAFQRDRLGELILDITGQQLPRVVVGLEFDLHHASRSSSCTNEVSNVPLIRGVSQLLSSTLLVPLTTLSGSGLSKSMSCLPTSPAASTDDAETTDSITAPVTYSGVVLSLG